MMKESDIQDNSILAGEYVLGTMDDADRAEFERRLEEDLQLQAEVDAGERRFGPLLNTVEPVSPPASVWRELERRTSPKERSSNPTSGLWASLQFWRGLGMTAAALVLGMALTLFTLHEGELGMDSMMVVLNDKSTAGWIVAAQQGRGYLNVRAVEPSDLPQGKVCHLWMKDGTGNMHPLGILPHSGSMDMPMPVKQASSQLFMVSIEEEADMPSDTPSQEIVFEGRLTEI